MPVVLQMEASECGAACLTMVLAAHGCWKALDGVRDGCGVSRDGVSATDILNAARRYGLDARAFSREVDDLGDLPFPQILYWNFDHFVVLESVRRGRFTLVDPARGRVTMERREFGAGYTGVTLAFVPSASFETTSRPPGVVVRLAATLDGSAGMFALLFLTSLLTVAIGVVVPGLTRVFVDEYLVQGRKDWLLPILAAVAGVGCARAVLEAVFQRGLLLSRTKITLVLSARLVWRLLHVPHEFLSRRSEVEVASRGQLAAQVAGVVSGAMTRAAVDVVALAALTTVMAFHSLEMTAAVLSLSVVNVAFTRWGTRAMETRSAAAQAMSARSHAVLARSAPLIENARATGTEGVLFARTLDAATRSLNAEQSVERVGAALSALSLIGDRLISIAVLCVGSWLVATTETTLGSVLGFLLLAEIFSVSLGELTTVGAPIGAAGAALTRLGDMLDRPSAEPEPPTPARGECDGGFVVDGVSFAYLNGAQVLADVSLTVRPGELIGVSGASGAGKTTLVRLLSGIVEPDSGRVAFERRTPEGEIVWDASPDRRALVDQTPFFPRGTLRSALTMWDATAGATDVRDALADAEMTEAINARAGGVDGIVGEGGGGFSDGEAQRLAIARALVSDPRLLIMDDATSALDEETEGRILANLRRRGVTVVLATNRAGALARMDRVFHLTGGRLHPFTGAV